MLRGIWQWFWGGASTEATIGTPGGIFRRPRWSWARTFARTDWQRTFSRPAWSWSRVWRYCPMASRIEPTTLYKPAGETRVMAFDLSPAPEVVAGETLSSPSIAGDAGITFGTPAVTATAFDGIASGKAVKVSVSGGTAGTTYDCALTVTTSGGSVLVFAGRIVVCDNY